MTYDPSQYTQLGVGDRVEAGHYKVPAATSCAVTPIPVGNPDIGTIVGLDDEYLYLRPNRAPAPAGMDSYATGAVRSNATGRGRFDLLPFEALLCLARRLEYGATLYSDRNWEKGMPLSRILSSLRRHASQINYDFSEDHLGAVLFNAAAFVTIAERVRAGILPRALDDLGYLDRSNTQQ